MSEVREVRATVALLTCNGGELLAEVVEAIRSQITPWPFELLVIDSSSTDGSLACLEGGEEMVLTIPRSVFNHGGTRNQAARAAHGEFIVFLVQDATPLGRQWLRRLVEGLELYPGAVGAYGRQVPRPDADPALVRRIEAWTPAGRDVGGREPVVKRIESVEAYRRMPVEERIRLSAFDNVCSVIRREYLLAHPFPELPFGEDICWGERQLLEGHALLYLPGAEVMHSHRRSYSDHLRRAKLEHTLLIEHFGLTAVPDLGTLVTQSLGVVAKGLREGPRGVGRQIAELTGQYLAGRGRQGRNPPF